jgi:hypothetical protein
MEIFLNRARGPRGRTFIHPMEQEEPVLTMNATVWTMPGISATGKAAQLFSRAGLSTIGAILRAEHAERRLTAVLAELKAEEGGATESYWFGLGSRCTAILRAVRSLDADPYPPDAYCCPLTHSWLEDAVVSPTGLSFSGAVIRRWLEGSTSCPMTRTALSADQLVPNRQLQDAVDHYRGHHMRLFPALRRPVASCL